MDDTNPDRSQNSSDFTRQLTQLEETNRALSRQVADCADQLGQVQTTLTEAQRVVAQNQQFEAQRSNVLSQERQLNELKSNFVTLASHEFRTPMSTILSSASLISRYNGEVDGDNRERHVQRIKSAVNSLTGMLNDFLSISQMDQQSVVSHPQSLNIVLFCTDVIADVQAVAKPRQRLLYKHVAGESTITSDGQMLKNILLNLLTNASKYSAEDTEIRLTSAVGDDYVTLTVRDQGIGIPDVDKDKLFINFFRARNAIHIQGTGLGLYLVKRYVDLLGGTITFTSQLDEGTLFTVRLPIANPPV